MEWSVAAVLIIFMLCRLCMHAIDRLKPEGGTDTTTAIGFHHDFTPHEDQ